MTINLNLALDGLQHKLGNHYWFGLSENDEVILRPRVQSCWGRVKEWYSRNFTDDNVRLRNHFQAFFIAAEDFLSQEKDPTSRNSFINKNIPILTQIYWAAQKMKTNDIRGFAGESDVPVLEVGKETEKLMLSQMTEAEVISAHLPRRIYDICNENSLITTRDLERPNEEGTKQLSLSVNKTSLKDSSVMIYYSEKNSQGQLIKGADWQLGFVHGATKVVAYFDEKGRDYIAHLNVPKTFLDGKPLMLYTALNVLQNFFPNLQISLIELVRAWAAATFK